MEEQIMMGKSSSSLSSPDSNSMVSTTVGRVLNTLLSARSKKLQDAISRLDSTPRSGSLGVSLGQSLWFLNKYIRDAAEEELLDQVLVPFIEHSLKLKESKHNNQVMILLNWIFQDEFLFEVLATNLASILLRKDDRYIALGWCTLVRGLVEYEISMDQSITSGIREKYSVLLKILCSCIPHLLSIVYNGSTLQGGFELPTRLSVAAADCILALTVALTKKDLASDDSDNGQKSFNPNASKLPITSVPAAFSEKKVETTSRSPDISNNMEMKLLLWNHLDDLIILVQRLTAWSRKSQFLHAKGLEDALKWLQGTKERYDCFQNEAGSHVLKTGLLLLSSCWKHYGVLLHLEHRGFSQHYKELLDQYSSGIQFYADNYTEENAENKDSGIETIRFFINCLSLLLGRFDNKQFESAISEYGLQISRVLISQLRYADEDVIDGAVCILKAIIFKANYSLSRSSLPDTRQMEFVLPLLLNLLDEWDGTTRAIVMLIAEYCSMSSGSRCLQEVLKRLSSGNILQRKNAVDVISELIHLSPDFIYCRQDIANHLLERIGDEELIIRAQVSNLIPMMDPSLVLPALLRLIFSSSERVQSSASNTLLAVLKYHNKKVEVICMLFDCLSLCQNPDLPNTSGDRGEGLKLDADRVLKLIPEWSKNVEDWNLLIGPLIDKMFAEPSNAIIVRFLSYISEHLANAKDVVFNQLLLHTQGQKKWESRTYSSDDSVELQQSLFCRLCPLLIIRLLPLRVFDDLNSSTVYGELLNQSVLHDAVYFDINNTECVAALLLNRAINKYEFEDVRKLAAELCGRIHPQVLFPIISSQLEHATKAQDVLKIKACLFSLCTSLVVRGRGSILPPVMLKIKEAIGTVLSWPSLDGDEVSKAQHGCIDCLALMVCTELQASESFSDSTSKKMGIVGKNRCSGYAGSKFSVIAYVIQQLTCDNNELSGKFMSEASVCLSSRLCMANVLISACQKISDSGKKQLARKILPRLIHSVGLMVESEIRAACIQVLFSAVYYLKSAVIPYSSDLLKVALKSLKEGSEKERMAGAKLMASLMASEEMVVESISGALLEAKAVLSSVSSSELSPELEEVCKQLLICLTAL
ncbi:uncharacterized protein LOC132292139 isoform X2 [Cornus florida]|uniref:uncharacterized protein LOC132292139 isoform X2 n=1 Tax=Cornus florida TaxID=4283 RepID=UPI00289BAA8A|nr:uncharacterized protein LOC132292139 isoform X2 [Cornus florida]